MADEVGQLSGNAWGDDIDEYRKVEIEALLQTWETDENHNDSLGPVDGIPLSGADVFWMAGRTLATSIDATDIAIAQEQLLVAQAPNLSGKEIMLEGLLLQGADLAYANLTNAYLAGASLYNCNLEGANLSNATLYGTDVREVNLRGAVLTCANLVGADLEQANLMAADLTDAFLRWTRLQKANLSYASLDGAHCEEAHLEGADLTSATFNSESTLEGVALSDTSRLLISLFRRFVRREQLFGSVSVVDVHWNGIDLTGVDWFQLRTLGDERCRRWWWRARWETDTAVRANVQVARQLRDAALGEAADQFLYRAQVRRRGAYLLRGYLVAWLFSWLMFTVSGYGYRPLRTLFWYLATIASFAFAFYWTAHGVITFGLHPSELKPLTWYEALVLSVSSFHGRGFLPFPNLGDPVTILAAIEAVLGLFLEVSFIATFTQRYFGK